MDSITDIPPYHKRTTYANRYSQKARRVGDISRVVFNAKSKEYNIQQIIELEPEADPEDLKKWSSEELVDYLQRIEVETDDIGRDLTMGPDVPTVSVTISDTTDVLNGIYSPNTICALAAESMTHVILNTEELTREQMAQVVRVLKPGGTITIKKGI